MREHRELLTLFINSIAEAERTSIKRAESGTCRVAVFFLKVSGSPLKKITEDASYSQSSALWVGSFPNFIGVVFMPKGR